MKEPLRQQLEFGLKQMGLHFSVPVQQKLVHYIQLIARWNKAFNLTAIRDVEDMVSKHLLDSLAVQPYVEGDRILDVGSGAGRISLYLQNQGHEVLATDNSPKALEICRLRGIIHTTACPAAIDAPN